MPTTARASVILTVLVSALFAQAPGPAGLLVPPDVAAAPVDFRLAKSKGVVSVVVRLKDPPLALMVGPNAKRLGSRLTRAQQQAYLLSLKQKQDLLSSQIAGLGGRELGRVSKVHNALMVSIDSSRLNQVVALANVATIRPVVDYEKTLGSTVPYVGAAAVQAIGKDGTGITVAVLDSGLDYTHRNLGGPGTVAAYLAAYGSSPADAANTTRDGLFPTAKVIEGYDFVGEEWPNGPLAFDPDPIDFEGHGTPVGDIIAGLSLDNTHKGVAPGAKLLAVKTCSSISTRCSGIGLLLGMDFAVDPNSDGDITDAADVINLSLGQDYGQREDDLSEACHVATILGVVVVASAGNGGDRPYIVGSPSTTPAVISVAQTQVPSALGYPLIISAPAAIAGTYTNTATLPFAPIGTGFGNGSIVFAGRGCPAGSVGGQPGADPYLTNPAGKVALIDRGACNISLKVDRAAKAGAIGVLIGLVAAGDAISFSFGGGDTFVPSLVITQATSNLIKARLGLGDTVLGTVSPVTTIPLAGSMVGSSSRGPGYSYQSIKPDIGAPGGSVSAEVGTGTGETAFSGTSGAAPMVAGSAALLLQGCPLCVPLDIKTRLMNTAEINILTNPLTAPGELAPITKIGAGEMRVNRAAAAKTQAWDAQDPLAVSLSFGHLRGTGNVVRSRKVVVRNLTGGARTYTITSSFRYAADAGGPVTPSAPPSLTVPANSTATFVFTLSINSNSLPDWTLNGGARGGDGFRLQPFEYDGYVTISDSADTIRVPWHVLPHKAANVRPAAPSVALGGLSTGSLGLTNIGGAVAGRVDIFSLTGVSGKFPSSTLPRPGDNFAIIDLKAAGIRMLPDVNLGGSLGVQDVLQVGVNTWGERAHPNYPAEFDIFIDVNRDGIDDYVAFNGESGGFAVSGQNVTTLLNLSTNSQVTRFFTDADLTSANGIFTFVRSDVIGLTRSAPFNFTVCAGDNYYTGVFTDCIGPMTVQLDTPRFTGAGVPATGVPANGVGTVTITRNPAGDAVSPSQSGLLLMHRDAKSGQEADAVTVTP